MSQRGLLDVCLFFDNAVLDDDLVDLAVGPDRDAWFDDSLTNLGRRVNEYQWENVYIWAFFLFFIHALEKNYVRFQGGFSRASIKSGVHFLNAHKGTMFDQDVDRVCQEVLVL